MVEDKEEHIRPIAIYLPQFHPIPENDEWWGKGFTEWTNVVKARPRFKGHLQPHLPADLGFYDLRLPEIREAQAALARTYNVHGFCYYHYWFNGKRVLDRPFREVFESGKPDFPFMLCWANENWTRIWDGGENSVLLKQEYSPEDDRQHIRALIPFFKDKRYIKVQEKPVFAIYRESMFPNIEETLSIFREEAWKEGLELYLCYFERGRDLPNANPRVSGFDAGIEFQPLSKSLNEYKAFRLKRDMSTRFLRMDTYTRAVREKVLERGKDKDDIVDYADFVDFDVNRPFPAYKLFPGVSPGWDNSSRRTGRRAVIFKNNTPEDFRRWVASKVEKFKPYSTDENFLFINAWNEWAEGNHLEPCQRHGHAFLQALKDGLKVQSGKA